MIADMPAKRHAPPEFGRKVFGVGLPIPLRLRDELTLDGEVLHTFGSLPVPSNVWRSLQRLGSWVEPVLGSE